MPSFHQNPRGSVISLWPAEVGDARLLTIASSGCYVFRTLLRVHIGHNEFARMKNEHIWAYDSAVGSTHPRQYSPTVPSAYTFVNHPIHHKKYNTTHKCSVIRSIRHASKILQTYWYLPSNHLRDHACPNHPKVPDLPKERETFSLSHRPELWSAPVKEPIGFQMFPAKWGHFLPPREKDG